MLCNLLKVEREMELEHVCDLPSFSSSKQKISHFGKEPKYVFGCRSTFETHFVPGATIRRFVNFCQHFSYTWLNLGLCFYMYSILRRWCSGIMQDSHSCDPGSIPGRRTEFLLLVRLQIRCRSSVEKRIDPSRLHDRQFGRVV